MQFNNKITIVSSQYDEFANKTPVTTAIIKCFVLNTEKSNDTKDGSRKWKLYISIIIKAKSVRAFTDFVNDNNLSFQFEGNSFDTYSILPIKDFSGKTKLYQIDLEQVRNANS